MIAPAGTSSERIPASVEKAVKLAEFDAYLSAAVAAVDHGDSADKPMVFYQVKVRLSQRRDATISAGFDLYGGSDPLEIAADLRKAGDLFIKLADEIAAGALTEA